MSALDFLNRLPHWEIWLPIVIGMVAGSLSIVAFKAIVRSGPRVKMAPRPNKEPRDYDPYQRPSASEQRKTLRRDGNPVEVYIAAEGSNEPGWRGWVIDRSMGGLCLSLTDEFKPGALLRVMPANATTMTPWTDIEVCNVRQAKDGFEVGCKFRKQPPWAILLLFG